MSSSSISSVLAAFTSHLEYDDIPRGVVEQAKVCLLDTLGATLAGFPTEMGRTFISLAREWGGAKEATIFGSGLKVPSTNAVLVNGTMGHIHELDDGDRFALGHPGVTSIPAAIAVAEKVGASGKEIITAIVIGYDIFSRVARAVNPSHRGRGFHTTGTCGTFGAAATAGKILGLDEKGMINALGIAGLQAAGLMEVMHGESMIKPFNAGRAGSNGVLSALLAEHGTSAPITIFEGDNGFFKAYSNKYDINKVTDGLGGDYHIMHRYVKLHAACRHTHPTIDCVLNLKQENKLNPQDIEKVFVKTYSAAYELTGKEYEPRTVSTAKFSIPYCVAVALIYGRVSPKEFTNDKLMNKKIQNLARRVHVKIDPKIDNLVPNKRGASVEILIKGGRKYKYAVENPRGEPETPISDEEVIDKFRTLVRPVLSQDKISKIINICKRLENLKDINNLIRFLNNNIV